MVFLLSVEESHPVYGRAVSDCGDCRLNRLWKEYTDTAG